MVSQMLNRLSEQTQKPGSTKDPNRPKYTEEELEKMQNELFAKFKQPSEELPGKHKY